MSSWPHRITEVFLNEREQVVERSTILLAQSHPPKCLLQPQSQVPASVNPSNTPSQAPTKAPSSATAPTAKRQPAPPSQTTTVSLAPKSNSRREGM